MRKILLAVVWTAVVLAALFNIAILMGMRQPRNHTSTRSMKLTAPPNEIWQALSNYAQQPQWRPDLKSVERLPDLKGAQVWRENYKNGMSQTLATEQSVAPVYLGRAIVDEKGPVAGTWTFTLTPVPGGGTQVELTERARIRNPFYRFMRAYVIKYRYMDNFLKQLASHLGEKYAQIT